MRDTIFMCAPTYFTVSYVINPWMHGNTDKIDAALATEQWNELFSAISAVADVKLIAPQPGLPDMVFTANAGLICGDRVVLSRFKHAERQGEEQHFQKFFSDYGCRVLVPPTRTAFEGAGDVLLDRGADILWMGFGHRSAAEAFHLLSDFYTEKTIIPLELVDERFYHLDTCFCPLSGGYVMYFPDAFSKTSQDLIKIWVHDSKLIAVREDDAVKFACNAVNVGNHVFLNAASEELVTSLREKGFDVSQISMSEFMKSGGASKCLTLKLNENC